MLYLCPAIFICTKNLKEVPLRFRYQYYNVRSLFLSMNDCVNTLTVDFERNEPLYNEVPGITNYFLYPNNGKTYEKEPQYKKTSL